MIRLAIAFMAAAVCFAGLAIAQEDDTITAEKLGENLEDEVGMSHTFRDRIAHIYRDQKQFPSYLKFDTANVRCRVLVGEEEDLRTIDAWSRGEVDDPKTMEFKDPKLQILWEIFFNEIQPQILSISGKVVEPEASGNFGIMHIFDVSGIERVKYSRDK